MIGEGWRGLERAGTSLLELRYWNDVIGTSLLSLKVCKSSFTSDIRKAPTGGVGKNGRERERVGKGKG